MAEAEFVDTPLQLIQKSIVNRLVHEQSRTSAAHLTNAKDENKRTNKRGSVIVDTWPWLNQIASTQPSTAESMSAFSYTTTGDLPPSSSEIFLPLAIETQTLVTIKRKRETTIHTIDDDDTRRQRNAKRACQRCGDARRDRWAWSP
jgi:hypothetical protein